MSCSFCSRAAFATPVEGIDVCEVCARAIGRLAKTDGGDVWSVVPVSRSTPPGPNDAPDEPSFTKMLRTFQRQVSERIASTDNESHYHLAHAYRAMGLHEDAVRAAGRAIDVDPPLEPPVPALELLLTAPLLREGGMERLRALLAPG